MAFPTGSQPFKFWCQKVLPLVYDDSLSYYELLCKVVDQINKDIEAINMLIDEMQKYEEGLTGQWDEYQKNLNKEWLDYQTNLNNEWNQYKTTLTSEWQKMQNWINNYFNNLDVQNEINNKLDQMAGDGTLDNIINNKLFNQFKTQLDSNTNNIIDLQQKINNIANGSPKGYYETITELTSAHPNGDNNIYVVKNDWFFWNGTKWTKGGSYNPPVLAPGSITHDYKSLDARQAKVTCLSSSPLLNGVQEYVPIFNIDTKNKVVELNPDVTDIYISVGSQIWSCTVASKTMPTFLGLDATIGTNSTLYFYYKPSTNQIIYLNNGEKQNTNREFLQDCVYLGNFFTYFTKIVNNNPYICYTVDGYPNKINPNSNLRRNTAILVSGETWVTTPRIQFDYNNKTVIIEPSRYYFLTSDGLKYEVVVTTTKTIDASQSVAFSSLMYRVSTQSFSVLHDDEIIQAYPNFKDNLLLCVIQWNKKYNSLPTPPLFKEQFKTGYAMTWKADYDLWAKLDVEADWDNNTFTIKKGNHYVVWDGGISSTINLLDDLTYPIDKAKRYYLSWIPYTHIFLLQNTDQYESTPINRIQGQVFIGSINPGQRQFNLYTANWQALESCKISILGDSISTFNGYIPNGQPTYYPKPGMTNVEYTWWKKFMDATGTKLLKNDSWSGSTVTTNAGEPGAGCGVRATTLGNPEIIIVYMGINDYGNNVDIGSYDFKTIPSDTTKFKEAYALMLYKIQANSPNSQVFCCTLPPTGGYPNFPHQTGKGFLLKDFNDAIRDCCQYFGCEIIDLSSSGITYNNYKIYYGENGDSTTHPNQLGMNLIANKVIKTISNSRTYSNSAKN